MRAVIIAIAPMILIIVHSLLGFSTVNPIGPLVGQVPSTNPLLIDRKANLTNISELGFGVLGLCLRIVACSAFDCGRKKERNCFWDCRFNAQLGIANTI